MRQPDADDGFESFGPVAGRVLRWLPMWVLVLFAAMWLLPTAAGLISSVRPRAFGRNSGWWQDVLDPSTWTLEPYRVALDASANNSFAESMVNSFAIAIPSTLIS